MGTGPKLNYQSVLPQVAHGAGYKTSLIVVNTAAANATADVAFTRSNGTPLQIAASGASSSTFNSTIPPLGVFRLDADASPNLAVGYGTIRSPEDLSGSALIQIMQGDLVATEAAVPFSRPGKSFTVYIDNLNDARSGYAVANFGTAHTLINAKLRNKDGVTLDTKSITVPSYQQLVAGLQLSEFASERFANAQAGFEGSIEFSGGGTVVSDGPGLRLGAMALRFDNAASDVFTTIPVIHPVFDENKIPDREFPPLPIGKIPVTLYYPQIADGGTYRTNLILVNTTNIATTAKIEFFANDGTPLALPIGGVQKTSHTIALNGKGVGHVITDGTSSEIKVGWARVTSAIPIGGSAIFQTVRDGRIVSEAGVPSSPYARHLATYADNVGSAQAGIAVANPGTSSVTVTFYLHNAQGQIIASATKTLTALGHVAIFFAELFPGKAQQLLGTVDAVANAPISAVALRFDNPAADVFAAVPMAVIPESK